MNIEWSHLPYKLNVKQIEKIDQLKEKYSDWIRKFSKGKCVSFICPYDKAKKRSFHLYLCHSMCKHKKDCDLYIQKRYLCRSLGCPNEEQCFVFFEKRKKFPEKARNKKCRSIHGKEKILLEKKYEEFFFNYKVFRGLKLDPLRTIRFLKKRAKKNGKVQPKKDRPKDKSKGQAGEKKYTKKVKRKGIN